MQEFRTVSKKTSNVFVIEKSLEIIMGINRKISDFSGN